MKRPLIAIAFVLIAIGTAAGVYVLKDLLPSSVTISSPNASNELCVEADFGGEVDADCLTNAGKITLSGRMGRDAPIYLTIRRGDASPQRQELVYAGRRFAMHCDVSIDQEGNFEKNCRRAGFADSLS